MEEERPQLAASEIEEELLRELQKLPTLHDTQSVTFVRSAVLRVGHGSWTESNQKLDLSKASSPTCRTSSLDCNNNLTSTPGRVTRACLHHHGRCRPCHAGRLPIALYFITLGP